MMLDYYNQDHLKHIQYKTPDNLRARISLHQRFSVNDYPWQNWVYDHLAIRTGQEILDVGCGPSDLWRENIERIPENVRLYLGDLSAGMLIAAMNNLDNRNGFHFTNLDAQSLPFPDSSIDLVTANHMLYHVPDILTALREIARVLKPEGRLVAATNGVNHMTELQRIIQRVWPAYDPQARGIHRFCLENAHELFSDIFENLAIHEYPDHLEVTDNQAVVDYICSFWDFTIPDHDRLLAEINWQLQDEIESCGYFYIQKSLGIILGTKGI